MSLTTPNPNFRPSPEWERLQKKLAETQAAADAPPPAPPAEEVAWKSEMLEEPAICEGCRQPFQAKIAKCNGLEIGRAKWCAACVTAETERRESEAQQSSAAAKVSLWEKICPSDYRATDLTRLRTLMLRKRLKLQTAVPKDISLDEIWRHEPAYARGLGIIGASGQGKTRIMYELLRRWHFERGLKIVAINAVHFADDLAAMYEHGAGHAERWMERIERVPVLFIDDLGKERLTERVESTYYRIFETRYSQNRRVFFTANMNGSQLEKKWQQSAEKAGFYSDRAEPIIRRLREMTDSITITDV